MTRLYPMTKVTGIGREEILNTLPHYGSNPFINEKYSGDIEKESRRIVDLLTNGKTPVEVEFAVET